jgi:hypothetical protein
VSRLLLHAERGRSTSLFATLGGVTPTANPTIESSPSIDSIWRNRIVGHADVPPADLVPNPRNWRAHPPEQQRALAGALAEVGWVAEVLVNRTSGNVVDGHLRIELALAQSEPIIPVTYVELSEGEERLVLASLDPLAAMATAEQEQLAALLAGLEPDDDALRVLLDDLAREYQLDSLRTGLVDPDDVPPIPDEPYVQPGDLYVFGDHRLLCGSRSVAFRLFGALHANRTEQAGYARADDAGLRVTASDRPGCPRPREPTGTRRPSPEIPPWGSRL